MNMQMNEQEPVVPVIETKKVWVHYGDSCALRDISLTVRERDFLGIIGPNGGGKSTLLKALLGLLEPSGGQIRVFGLPPRQAAPMIGYVPQLALFERSFPISVKDVVLMGRLPLGLQPFHRFSKADREAVDLLLQQTGIWELRERQISRLSGGEFQKTLIARALATGPRLLVLDEPTASVDARSREQIYHLLNELNKEMTIILVTHDLNVISAYVSSLACLNGSLYYHGAAELNNAVMEEMYGCPVELISHGVPHRVLGEHENGGGV